MSIRKKLKIKSVQRGVSDSRLCSLARKAAFLYWGEKCLICGGFGTATNPLEGHHFIRRAHRITRWLWKDYFPVHKYDCHQKADSNEGRDVLRGRMGEEWYKELTKFENITIKDIFTATGLTMNEFKQLKKRQSENIIKKYER